MGFCGRAPGEGGGVKRGQGVQHWKELNAQVTDRSTSADGAGWDGGGGGSISRNELDGYVPCMGLRVRPLAQWELLTGEILV